MNKTARFLGHLKTLNVFTSIASSRRNKLLCAFLVMTGLIIVLSVLTWLNQAKAQAKIDDIAAVDFRLGRLGLEIGNTIQTAQGYQKDYLLQYQQLGVEKARAVYLKNFQTAVARIHQKTGEIKHVAIDPQDLEAVDTIDRAIDAYQTAFESVVTWLQNRAGFAALLPAQVDSIDRGIQAVGYLRKAQTKGDGLIRCSGKHQDLGHGSGLGSEIRYLIHRFEARCCRQGFDRACQ